jgi:hypothetical protein
VGLLYTECPRKPYGLLLTKTSVKDGALFVLSHIHAEHGVRADTVKMLKEIMKLFLSTLPCDKRIIYSRSW